MKKTQELKFKLMMQRKALKKSKRIVKQKKKILNLLKDNICIRDNIVQYKIKKCP